MYIILSYLFIVFIFMEGSHLLLLKVIYILYNDEVEGGYYIILYYVRVVVIKKIIYNKNFNRRIENGEF